MYITDLFDREDIRDLFNQTNVGITVSDPTKPDNPLIYVNKTFLSMTGFEKDDVIGRNCSFLQGVDTDEATISTIRTALRERTKLTVTIKNHRKNGEAFWNRLNITPIFDDKNQLKYFLGVQEDITQDYIEKLSMRERIKELENKVTRFEREIKKNI